VALPSAAVFERAGLKAWPGIEVEWDGTWVRRATNGYTKRANSVQSLDIADDANAPARLAAATTSRQCENANNGNSQPTISVIRNGILLSPVNLLRQGQCLTAKTAIGPNQIHVHIAPAGALV